MLRDDVIRGRIILRRGYLNAPSWGKREHLLHARRSSQRLPPVIQFPVGGRRGFRNAELELGEGEGREVRNRVN